MKKIVIFIPAIIILIIGILTTTAFYYNLQKKVKKESNEYIEGHILERKFAIENEIKLNLNILKLFEHDWGYPYEEFRKLAIPILKSHSDISNLYWVEQVASKEKHLRSLEYEKRGVKIFKIIEQNKIAEYVEASDRDFYYPIVFKGKDEDKTFVEGFDLGSIKSLNIEFEQIIEEGQIVLTESIKNPMDSSRNVFLAILPIFNIDNELEDKVFKGFVFAEIEYKRFVENALATFKEESIGLKINDVTIESQSKELYSSLNELNFSIKKIKPLVYRVNNANRVWELSFYFYEKNGIKRGHLFILFIGIALTCLIAFYVLFAVIKENKVKRLSKDLLNKIEEKNKIEKDLRESEKKFRLLYDNAPLSYQSLDENGSFIDVNQAWLDTLGYTRDEIIGRHFTDFMTLESATLVKSRFQSFKDSGELHDYQFELICKDKTIIIVSFEGKIGYDGQGNFKQTHCIFQDITERKKTEDRIKKQQYYLEKAQEIGKIGTWEYNFETDELFWTKENYKIFGVKEGTEVNYELFLDIVHPDDRSEVDKEWRNGIEQKEYIAEHRIIVDGEIRWVKEKADFIFNEKRECIKAVGVTQDITLQKKTDALIKESEEKYRAAFVTSPDAININTLDGVFVDTNEGFTKIMGYEREEIIGKSSLEMNIWLNPEEREILTSNLIKKGEGDLEAEFKSKNGEILTGLISAKYIQLNNEKHIISITKDITKQKDREKLILKAIIETEEKERKRFAEDLHDELGPFLSGIKLYIKELSYEDVTYDQRISVIEYLNEFINTAVEKTRSISNQLMPNALTDYGLAKALKSFCQRINNVKEINIEFESNMTERIQNETIEVILYRIGIELINNSIKHAEASLMSVSLNRFEDIIQLTFIDNGKGFDFEKELSKDKGLGLKNMINRLNSIKGKYKFVRKPKGIHINIIIDLSLK